jgi:hypothetical protein
MFKAIAGDGALATLSNLEILVQLLEEDLLAEMGQTDGVEKKDDDLVIAQDQVVNLQKAGDSFDRILREEEDSGPDPNSSGGVAAPSDSHKAIQEILQKSASQLSSAVQSLATTKARMSDFFSK